MTVRSTLLGCSALMLMTALPALAPASAEAQIRSSGRASAEMSVIQRTNAIRAQHGCRPLTFDKRLRSAARKHAEDMSSRDYFSHVSKNGRTWTARIRAEGYSEPAGENIARGFRSDARVVSAWMNSPSHRENILRCQFNRIGVGYVSDGGFWVQDFGY